MTIFDRWLLGSNPPFATLIGIELVSMEKGSATVSMEASERHANPMGTLHGGILCDLADAAMGTAWASELDDGETFTTVELKINFFRPVWKSTITARAKVVRRGRTLGYVECDVFDDQERLVARAACSCMTLRGGKGEGR